MLLNELHSYILSFFSSKSLVLSKMAFDYIEDLLIGKTIEDIGLLLNFLIEELLKTSSSPIVSDESIKSIINNSSKSLEDSSEKSFLDIIDLKSCDVLKYDEKANKFSYSRTTMERSDYDRIDILSVYRNRYFIIKKLLTSHCFFKETCESSQSYDDISGNYLTSIEKLLFSEDKSKSFFILGMLNLPLNDCLFVEDCTGRIKINLNDAIFLSEIIPYNSIVLIEGVYDGAELSVIAIGLPPIMSPLKILEGLQNFDNQVLSHDKISWYLTVFSHFNFDDNEMFSLLERKMDDFIKKNTIPCLMIFCGTFVNHSNMMDYSNTLKRGLNTLAKIIISKSQFSNCKFIFVPSVNDFGLSSVFPRGPIPKELTEDFSSVIINSYFLSNPCRFKFRNKDIYIIREDLIEKISRFSLKKLQTTQNVPTEFLKLFLSQLNILPLPYMARNFIWSCDHFFSLIPRPSIIICADSYSSFSINQENCYFINPGDFKNDCQFENPFVHLIQ